MRALDEDTRSSLYSSAPLGWIAVSKTLKVFLEVPLLYMCTLCVQF